MEKIRQNQLDLNVHACKNGFYVTTRTNDPSSQYAVQKSDEYVFANLAEMFKFFKEHFINEENEWKHVVGNDIYATDGSPVFGGGS